MFNKPKVEITINEVENRKRVKLTDNKNKVHRLPTFYDGEDISGKVEIFLTSKTFEHKGVKLQLIGEIKNLQKLKSKTKSTFISLSNELIPPGVITEPMTTLPFVFNKLQAQYESYKGDFVEVRYYIRVTIITTLRDLKFDSEFSVINPQDESILKQNDEQIKLDVGIEDKLKLSIVFFSKNYKLKGEMNGEVTFKKVNFDLKSMDLMIMKREIMKGDDDYDPAILGKYEIMDGGPFSNETVPIRIYLKPYDLTPTYDNVNNKFSVRYYRNLVLVDSTGNKFFKQKEVCFYRIKKKKKKQN